MPNPNIIIVQNQEFEIHCPINQTIMYHPVMLNSGKTFELSVIVEHIKRNKSNPLCPLTRIPITSVVYHQELKKALDTQYANDLEREEAYSEETLLKELHHLLHFDYSILPKALFTGATTGLVIYSALKACVSVGITVDNLNTLSLLATAAVTILDIAMRTQRRDQLGLFSAVSQSFKQLFHEAEANLDDPELGNRRRL